MIAFIKGILEIKTNGYVIIETTSGVGYKIFMPQTDISKLPEIGETAKVYTFMRVREDDISLYGFSTNEELRMFELLLSVSGIGAKVAITILFLQFINILSKTSPTVLSDIVYPFLSAFVLSESNARTPLFPSSAKRPKSIF